MNEGKKRGNSLPGRVREAVEAGSEIGHARGRAASPRADTDCARTAQTAVGQTCGGGGAVGAEHAFLHVHDVAVIRRDIDAEAGAAVLTQELARTIDLAVGDLDDG